MNPVMPRKPVNRRRPNSRAAEPRLPRGSLGDEIGRIAGCMARKADSPSQRVDAHPGFDFTHHVGLLCDDITTRVPEMSHIDVRRVAISFCQTRKRVRHGFWASLTPMRFANGNLTEMRRGGVYTVQRLYDSAGVEMLYVLAFYLPRFLQLSFMDKLVTIFHELWHINPEFNGDIRRFEGRCYAHTHSEKEYDDAMLQLAKRWLAMSPPNGLYQFLKMNHGRMCREYGRVYGTKIPHPKLLPLKDRAS